MDMFNNMEHELDNITKLKEKVEKFYRWSENDN